MLGVEVEELWYEETLQHVQVACSIHVDSSSTLRILEEEGTSKSVLTESNPDVKFRAVLRWSLLGTRS